MRTGTTAEQNPPPLMFLDTTLPRESSLTLLSWAGEITVAGRARGRGRGGRAADLSVR